MCVYNGERFLARQLGSLTGQSQLPERVAIVDDGSTDGSWELLTEWRKNAPFEVRLARNESNVGVVKNFERAIGLLGEDIDIVFFADQDDIWYPTKLRRFVDPFVEDAAVGLVHSDADLIDENDERRGRSLLQALLLTNEERADVGAGRAYRSYAKRNLVTGAACACRRDVLTLALPFSTHQIHDEWIAFTASLVSRVVLLDECTMAYRLHGHNTVGLPLPTFVWRVKTVLRALVEPQKLRQLQRVERLCEMRDQAAKLRASDDALACVDAALAHARFRSSLPQQMFRRIAAVRTEWRKGQYHAWSNGRTSALHDILMAN